MNLKQELEQRWFLYQFTNDALFDLYEKGGQNFYLGIDPSSDSLQLGNLCAIMAAVNLMKKWNKCYFLIGGATWMIGDPSGKDAERNFLGEEKLRDNEKKIYQQVVDFLDNLKKNYGLEFDHGMVNNFDFYKDMSVLDFWSQVGKYITVNMMMAKDSVKKRLIDPDQSISYTEFSYMLIQWYDFVKLYEDKWVNLQLGGSDQWGNITTGIEIAKKKLNADVFGLTIPLITDSTGKKFWKSEGNAIWLDPKKNSPYVVYQYFLNTNDADVEKYLKVLTLLSFEEISDIVSRHNEDTASRYGQKVLAEKLVELIFGFEALGQVKKITEILFGNEDKLELVKSMDNSGLLALKQAVWWIELSGDEFRVLDLCTQSGISASNGEAKKLIQSGSIYCNEEKIDDLQKVYTRDDLINWILLLRKGKKVFRVLKK